MIEQKTRVEIGAAVTDFIAAVRDIVEPGAPQERQVELMQEAIALLLAGHMFASEQKLHLGPRTEMLRVTDRAHATYERFRDHAAATMRKESGR